MTPFESSLPQNGYYLVNDILLPLVLPLLAQEPSKLASQMTSTSQPTTMPLQFRVVLIPPTIEPTQASSTKSSSLPPQNNVNSPSMSPHNVNSSTTITTANYSYCVNFLTQKTKVNGIFLNCENNVFASAFMMQIT
jgi:hypothetical protein